MKTIMKSRKTLLIVLLIMCLPLLGFIVSKFPDVSKYYLSVSRQLKLASVDVSNLEVSTLLIDVTDGNKRYTDSYTWNATDSTVAKNITYQVNYKQTSSYNIYKAGELEITVPNLLKTIVGADSKYYTSSYISISADKSTDTVKKNTWSYHYSDDYTKIIFVNNNDIEMNNGFEGSVQVSYVFYPVNIENGLSVSLKSTLNTKESNTLSFAFTSNKKTYHFTGYEPDLDSLDGLPSGDYIWIKLCYRTAFDNGVRYLYNSENSNDTLRAYVTVDAPSDAIIYGQDYKELSKKDGKYFYYVDGYGDSTVKNIYSSYTHSAISYTDTYVGLPRSTYFDKTVNLGLKLYGIYTKANPGDVIDANHTDHEFITSFSKSYKVSSYEFNYSGDLYSVTKTSSASRGKNLELSSILDGTASGGYYVSTKSVYIGEKFDIMLGDDLLLYHSAAGQIRRLTDDEYYFDSITFPSYARNGAGQYLASEKYTIDLYVRYAHESSYVLYQTFKNKNITFKDFPKNVVAYYFYLHDASESIDVTTTNTVKFHFSDATAGSSVYNFDFLKIYKNGAIVNTPENSSYSTSLLQNYVRPFDISNHGRNVQRDYISVTIENFIDWIDPTLSVNDFTTQNDKFSSRAIITARWGYFGQYNYGYSESFKGWEEYLLLPKGVYYESTETIYRKNLFTSTDLKYIKKSDGSSFASVTELDNFFVEHKTLTTHNNWNNTGRQLVKIVFDFHDSPLNGLEALNANRSNIPLYEYSIPIYTTKDALEEYGTTLQFNSYAKAFGDKYTKQYSSSYSVADTLDINEDGDKTEYLSYNNLSKMIITAIASNQDIVTYAETNETPFTSYTAISSPDTTYTYKLRTRNLNNKITNLVIYDSIEGYAKENNVYVKASGTKNAFRGTFVDVDTTYAQKQGYTVKVYYSESEQPGSLGSDTTWKAYTSTTDKTKVKSLAFEYLNASNGKAVLPEDTLTYVEIIMKSPSETEEGIMTTYNGAWSEWNPLDTSNNVQSNKVYLASRITEIELKGVVKTRYLDFTTGESMEPDSTKEYANGASYTTSGLTPIPEGYRLKEQTGDSPSGTINKASYTINYIYELMVPKLTSSNVELSAPTKIDKRSDAVDYNVVYNAVVTDYIGDTRVNLTMNLPYEIDTTKSSLDGGTYNSANKTITWNHTNTSTEYGDNNISYTHNISIVYKNIPIINTTLESSVESLISFADISMNNTALSSVNIDEKYKVISKYIDIKDNSDIIDPIIDYYLGGASYTTEAKELEGYELQLPLPENQNATVNAEEITVYYKYRKIIPAITNDLVDNSYTQSIDNRTNAVTYSFDYKLSVTDFIGTSTNEIVMQLPYEIDVSKSSIDDAEYNSEAKTLKWTKNLDTSSYVETSMNVSHTVSLVFINVPVSPNKFSTSITSSFKNSILEKNINNTYETTVNEKYKVVTKYVNKEDGSNVVDPLEEYYLGGETYTTTPKNIDGYELISEPSNKTGKVESEEIEVVYTYRLLVHTITNNKLNDSYTESVTKRNDPITYSIEYEVSTKDYKGTSTMTIVDSLPYEIDVSKSSLDGGTYDNSTKTITWNHTITTDTYVETNKTYSHTISVVYKNIPVIVRKITNRITSTFVSNDLRKVVDDTYETTVNEKFKVITKYINTEDGSNVVDPLEEYYFGGEDYTTTPKNINGYELISEPSNKTGKVENEITEVIYTYRLLVHTITNNKISDSYIETINNRNNTITYSFEYKVSIKDYIGISTYEITMQLPYEIDTTKSTLDGGTYNSTNKTITWNQNIATDTYVETNTTYNHTIDVVYKNIPVTVRNITSSLTSTLVSNDLRKVFESTYETTINEKYKVVTKYVNTADGSNVVDPLEEYYLGGETYTTTPKNIDGYELISEPTNKTGKVESEEIEVVYIYRLLVHTITNNKINDSYTDSVTKRNDPITYSIEYEVSTKDYKGTSTMTIVDSLPYEIDVSKSSLDGGTYDSVNKTITWNHTITTDTYVETSKTYSHTISVVYKNISVITRNMTNRITSTFVSNDLRKVVDDTYETAINEKYPVTIRYLEYGTDNPIIEDKVDYYFGGEDYTTTPEDIDVYDLKSTPINKNGKVESDSIEVIYYYEKRDPIISSSIDESGSESLESRDGLIEYNLSFNPEIKDYIGTVLVKIEDKLPYEIDEEKSELNGGLYDRLSKTITWEDSFDILSSAMVTKNYNYRIRLMYKDIDSSVDIINNVEGTVVLADRTITRSTNYSTAITIPGTIKVKYVDIESGEEIEEEVKSVNIINNKYYPASKYIDGYYLVETPELTSYTFDEEDQTIYYKYKKIVTKEEKVEPSQNKIDENPQTGIFDYISYIIMTVITIIGITITLNIRKKKIFRRV